MIKTVAELASKFVAAERAVLDADTLKHGPTIGSMYEGLTAATLERMIPEAFGLRVVSGFATWGDSVSGELDCMLVSGEGEPIPHTDKYRWPIDQVLAVFEVKKTLSRKELCDSHDHLRRISEIYTRYVHDPEREHVQVDLKMVNRVYGMMTGTTPPDYQDLSKLPFHLEMLYHTLLSEYLGPVRIVVGHHGWKREITLREHINRMVGERVGTRGMGAGSFPQLIIGGEYCLVKANGFPYVQKLNGDMWPLLLSTNHNPLRLLLELVMTKIEARFGAIGLQDESLDMEALSPCISGKAVVAGTRKGWEYSYTKIPHKALTSRGSSFDWQPMFPTVAEFVVLNRLANEGRVSTIDPQLVKFLRSEGVKVPEFVRNLRATGLVAVRGDSLVLTTTELLTGVLPDGRYFAGENNSGLVTEFVKNFMEKADNN